MKTILLDKILPFLMIGGTLVLIALSVAGIVFLVSQENKIKSKEGFIYRLFVIDSCQYISYGGSGITHKGNCTNIFHKTAK